MCEENWKWMLFGMEKMEIGESFKWWTYPEYTQKNNITRFAWYIVKIIIEPTNNVPNVTGTTKA